jgi:hypothetical protein
VDVERARETIATEKPRRLRLDEMLRELGARMPEATAPENTLDERQKFTLGELVDRAAEAGFGFVVGVLSLIAIPFFGMSTPFGLAIALVSIQLAAGRMRPWLPRRARKRVLSMGMLDRVLALLDRRMRWLAKSTRRRWEPMIMPRLVGLSITFLALGLALPLPIPGSNMIFIVPILIYATGLLERDGVWIVTAHVCTLVDLALLVAFGATVVAVLERAWHWLF